MALYAISDLHLALSGEKPMDVFGEKWFMHHEKIKSNWLSKVSDNDTVLIAGDISWSMKMEEGLQDLKWIHELPGSKVLIKGNHDYWWSSISKLNSLYEDMIFLQNSHFNYGEYAICGSRGWTCPGGENYTKHDEKIYNRELIRLRLSLEQGRKSGKNRFIVMLHYPPTNDKYEDSGFTEIFKEYSVEKVIYGHLHGPSLNKVLQGYRDGTEYMLTSCDFIDFDPIRLL